MDQIISILEGIRPGVDYETEDELIDDGILTSFDVMTLVNELNEAFGIEIGMEDMVPENFNSVEAIEELVKSLGED
ncbi:MAG: acyl carrier protein [Clostridiales bacterium]|jgi:acyl carrier protein|uniref:acyl carrier protein n=1 Tax=Chordicoccus furentiruminis TaxID=2709410 RepID=UPI0023A81F9B|nr:acyl carrier protein [Chordicoccus furentiruminis]MCI6173002.1 acyl carrier protein [Clostridiales bacterium]